MPHPRGLVLYDSLLVRGGAERVTLLTARALHAELCVGFRQRSAFPDDELHSIRIHDLGAATRIVPWRYIKLSRAFMRSASLLTGFDWALFSGACAPLALRRGAARRNLYYCHALPSFAYDLEDFYLSRIPGPSRPMLRALNAWLRPRYEDALARMDTRIANSAATRDTLREFTGLDSTVVHPPVDVDAFAWQEAGTYYLSTARLEPHKRVDLVIDAFRQLPDKQLVVAGWGSAGPALRRQAQDLDNVRFAGWVEERGMRDLLGACIASIYLGKREPFGMSPVESMASGKPVIGVAEGGLLETVVDGETGILLPPEPDVDEVTDAVLRMTLERALAMRAACEQRAAAYSRDAYLDGISSAVGAS